MRVAAIIVSLLLFGAVAGPNPASAIPPPPARFVGNVFINGVPAVPGTTVEARIGGVSCGSSTVFPLQNGVTYRVDVDAADVSTNPGCGTAGAIVDFYVAGVKAAETGTWTNFELHVLDLHANTLQPATCARVPALCEVEAVLLRWNLPSLAWLEAILIRLWERERI